MGPTLPLAVLSASGFGTLGVSSPCSRDLGGSSSTFTGGGGFFIGPALRGGTPGSSGGIPRRQLPGRGPSESQYDSLSVVVVGLGLHGQAFCLLLARTAVAVPPSRVPSWAVEPASWQLHHCLEARVVGGVPGEQIPPEGISRLGAQEFHSLENLDN